MDWLLRLFSSDSLSILFLITPTLFIIAVFIYSARRAHIKHLERIEKIKQGYFLSEDE